jgi:hypothetical protein
MPLTSLSNTPAAPRTRQQGRKVHAPGLAVLRQGLLGRRGRGERGALRRRARRLAHAHRDPEAARQVPRHPKVIRMMVRDQDGLELLLEPLAHREGFPGGVRIRLIHAGVDQHAPGTPGREPHVDVLQGTGDRQPDPAQIAGRIDRRAERRRLPREQFQAHRPPPVRRTARGATEISSPSVSAAASRRRRSG